MNVWTKVHGHIHATLKGAMKHQLSFCVDVDARRGFEEVCRVVLHGKAI